MINMISKIIESINKFPERNAFFIKDEYFTYSQLGKEITGIKNALLPHLPDASSKHIGVMMYEDLPSYSSCVAVLLSGCGYVPLNPLNPVERNIEIIHQAGVKIVLSSNGINESEYNKDNRLTIIDTCKLSVENIDLTFPPSFDYDPAYVIFTSGSTGKPKGAPISRENLNAFLDSVRHIGWEINEEDKFLQMSSMTFDMSILTFIIPLCVGACIYTVPEDEIKYLYGFKLMVEQGITFIAVVPSTLSYLKPYFTSINLPAVRYSLVCGESFPVELANLWQHCVPNAKIVNIYGPTEATVFTHSYHYSSGTHDKSYNGIMALGDLVKNMETILLDETGTEVIPGEKGELCITGKQLTSGYLNNPAKNKESFFVRMHDNIEKRFYRTGDIVFADDEKCYFYVGRKDHQVKIQGHRVELGDIEKHARDITHTENTIAIAQLNEFGNYQILLFTDQMNFDREVILKYLKSKLPYYMIPSNVMKVEKMPMNVNGKINRIALSEMIKTE
ncbi:MAG: amino acid adenylation domain-containing protein [Bacteroidetes bacterium]|nr:amino acid adenylation domain-containing protein [Bacteroidota bacterium]